MILWITMVWHEVVHTVKYVWPAIRTALVLLLIVGIPAYIAYAQTTIKWRLRIRRWGDRYQVDIIKDQECEIEAQKKEIAAWKEKFTTLETAHRESYGLILEALNTMIVKPIPGPILVKRRMARG